MVAFAVGGSSGLKRISGLLHVGGVAGQPLHLWPLYLTFLFSRALRLLVPRTVRPQAGLVSQLSALLSALLILWIPGLFRLTCYYYRGAYYKSFWADPPACAVSEPRKTYLGERSFP
jgi:hypothetical protein